MPRRDWKKVGFVAAVLALGFCLVALVAWVLFIISLVGWCIWDCPGGP